MECPDPEKVTPATLTGTPSRYNPTYKGNPGKGSYFIWVEVIVKTPR